MCNTFQLTRSLLPRQSSPIGCAFSLSGVDSSLIASSNDAEGNGLLRGHAYGLEQLKEVAGRRLLRLRNPWGRGEWNGPWSDGAEEWTDELQALLDYDFDDDGTFWMELQDFLQQFNTLYLAHVDEAVQRALLKFDNPMKSPFAVRSSEWPSLVEHIDDKGAALTDQQLWEEVESDEEDDADFGAVDNSRSPLLERAQRMHDRMAQQLSSTHVHRQVEEMMQVC
ncbi:hypothetical protein AB1Y20_015369 [Prymnesium parvum]|uniref:Calpain catalytic domain-containing protein n=1 Tax=Prymnesium parvum TaxID=97485 RepID=A0AB34JXL8_PRYPA